jgi:hypothetical protein
MNMRLIFARVVAVLLALAGFQNITDAQNDNWIKTTGSWSLGSNWSTGSPPTSSQNAVITNSGAAVSEDINATIQNLTIGSGDSLGINNGISLTIKGSTISNSGNFSINSGGNGTDLIIGNSNTTLTGTGTLTLSNNSQNFIFGSAGADKLTNQSTIQGSGNIGNGQMTLANSGTIDANAGAGQNALIIRTSGGTANTGTLEATSGSNLILEGASGGNFTNTSGTITAVGSGSTVQLNNGVTITGGMLTTSSGGLIFTPNNAILSGLTLSTGSNYQINNAASTTLVGTITNNGTMTLASGGNATNLDINGNVTLNGKGAVAMSNNSQNFIVGTTSSAVLTNNSTIKGAGNIGEAGMGLVNGKTGSIIANAGAGQNVLNIQPDTKNFTNNGTVEAVSGSVLDIITTGGSFTNFSSATSTLTGGSYIANNATIEFPAGSNGIVTGAANITLSGASAEIFSTTANTNALANFNTIAAGGSFTINSGANFTTAGNFTNNGTLTVGSGSSLVVNLADSLTNFNGTTHTLTGGSYLDSGVLQFKGANIRAIAANTSLTMSGASAKIEDQTGAANGLTNFATNNGTFGIASGFNFTTAGNFTNNGILSVGSGTKFTVNLANSLTNFNNTTHTLTGGTYGITGTLQFNNASIVTNAANITLTGTTSQIVNQSNANALANFATNNGSFALAGKRSLSTAGNFTNAGTLTINTGSTFTVGGPGIFNQSGGKTTDSGILSASGGINLNGGSLFGTGSITGALKSSSAAAVSPGASSTTAGILKETGAYTQNSGILDINVNGKTAGTQYDQFNPTMATLSGTLNITRLSSFIPAIGTTFKIMNFSSKTGTFSTVNGTAINASEHFAVTYQPTDVLLTVVAGAASTVQPESNVLATKSFEKIDFLSASDHTLMAGKGSTRPTVVAELNTSSRVPDQDSTLALFQLALFACALFRYHPTNRHFVSRSR